MNLDANFKIPIFFYNVGIFNPEILIACYSINFSVLFFKLSKYDSCFILPGLQPKKYATFVLLASDKV